MPRQLLFTFNGVLNASFSVQDFSGSRRFFLFSLSSSSSSAAGNSLQSSSTKPHSFSSPASASRPFPSRVPSSTLPSRSWFFSSSSPFCAPDSSRPPTRPPCVPPLLLQLIWQPVNPVLFLIPLFLIHPFSCFAPLTRCRAFSCSVHPSLASEIRFGKKFFGGFVPSYRSKTDPRLGFGAFSRPITRRVSSPGRIFKSRTGFSSPCLCLRLC